LHLVGYLHRCTKMMHGHTNINFINAKQVKEIHLCMNIKRKLHRANAAAIWYNKLCRENRPKHVELN